MGHPVKIRPPEVVENTEARRLPPRQPKHEEMLFRPRHAGWLLMMAVAVWLLIGAAVCAFLLPAIWSGGMVAASILLFVGVWLSVRRERARQADRRTTL